MQSLLFVVSIALGLTFAYVDSRPTWDDTGVLAFAIAISCAMLGYFGPRRPWLWALGVGLWIPAHNILRSGNLQSLLAMAFAFGGAYAGAALRRISPPRPLPQERRDGE